MESMMRRLKMGQEVCSQVRRRMGRCLEGRNMSRKTELSQDLRNAGQRGAICMHKEVTQHKTDWTKASRGLLSLRDTQESCKDCLQSPCTEMGETDIVLEVETAKHLDKTEDWEMGFSWCRNDCSVPAHGWK